MIFGAKNEKGTSTCDLVLSGKKIATRRLLTGRLYRVGYTYSVQRGRGTRAEGQIMIVSAIKHIDWVHKNVVDRSADTINRVLQREAEAEGFMSWKGLLDYMAKNNIDINNTIKYRFRLLDGRKC
jgi:hypothetical protein